MEVAHPAALGVAGEVRVVGFPEVDFPEADFPEAEAGAAAGGPAGGGKTTKCDENRINRK